MTTKNPGNTVWYAEMGSTHFTFRAFGSTRRKALDAMRKGLKRHCRNCGISAEGLLEYAGEGDENGDINVFEMTVGAAYCDWEKL